MRLRFPIPAKLLAGFLANLALLALGFWLVVRAQFDGAPDQLFAGLAEPRLQALAEKVAAEMRTRPEADWEALLSQHRKDTGVEYSLFNGDIEPMMGPQKDLPSEVRSIVADKLAPHLLNRPGPEDRNREDRDRNRDREERPPPPPERDLVGEMLGLPPVPQGRRPSPDRGPPTMDPALTTYPKITAHTSNPSAYWVVVRIPAISSSRGWLPVLLVMRSTSLTAGGLFFDVKPWIYASLGVLLLSGLIWLPIAFGLTRSLRRIKKATVRIAEGDFAVNVPDANRNDELGELGRSVHQMAERLEGHVRGQKRFLGDIAHELCSPIARMHASLGILEQRSEGDEKSSRYLEKVSGELKHMSALVSELLSFSKASLKNDLVLKPLKLAPLVEKVMEREDLASSQVRVEVPAHLAVLGDQELLARALGNLVRNAQRYAGGASPIEIRASRSNGHVLATVSDRGPGVPAEALPRLLEPFYRPDAARTRESGGVGLGLAIVKSCVESCGGKVEVANREGGGLEVTLHLTPSNAADVRAD